MSDLNRPYHGAVHDHTAGPSNDSTEKRHILDYGQSLPGKPVLYTQKDVDAAKKFESDAETLLGKLEIDHKPGVSRADIIAAEGKKHVSPQYQKILHVLNNMEPGVQDAWQVPDHRKHLAEHAQATFYIEAAELLVKNGQKKWASDLIAQAGTLNGKAGAELRADSEKQYQVYFHQVGATPAKLAELKEQTKRVELALNVLPQSEKAAENLLKKLDPLGRGLTNSQIENFARGPANNKLTWTERTLLQAVADFQKDSPVSGKVPVKDIAEDIRIWAISQSRSDDNSAAKLFFRATEGYKGNAEDIRDRATFNREMDSKNHSQLTADARSYQYHSVPQLGIE